MPTFILAEVDVTNPELYKQYAAQTPDSLKTFGGEFIIRANPVKVLEGDWNHDRLVLIRFENAQMAQNWYNSPFYQEIRGIRIQASKGKILLIET